MKEKIGLVAEEKGIVPVPSLSAYKCSRFSSLSFIHSVFRSKGFLTDLLQSSNTHRVTDTESERRDTWTVWPGNRIELQVLVLSMLTQIHDEIGSNLKKTNKTGPYHIVCVRCGKATNLF